jgi:hypothetical protein
LFCHVIEHIIIMYTFHRLHASIEEPVPKHHMMVMYTGHSRS